VITACPNILCVRTFPILLSLLLLSLSVIIDHGGGARMPGLYTSIRIRRYGGKCSGSNARSGSEQSAWLGGALSPEGFPPAKMSDEVLCI